MRGFGYRKNTESSTWSMSGTEWDEGISIGVLLAAKAKHQTTLKKFCSVPFFDLMRQPTTVQWATVQVVFVLFQNKVEENLIVSSEYNYLKSALSICLSVCLSVSLFLPLFLPPSLPLHSQNARVCGCMCACVCVRARECLCVCVCVHACLLACLE